MIMFKTYVMPDHNVIVVGLEPDPESDCKVSVMVTGWFDGFQFLKVATEDAFDSFGEALDFMESLSEKDITQIYNAMKTSCAATIPEGTLPLVVREVCN
jgi:hypothetical protein